MSRAGILLGGLCLLPVAYLVYAWGVCADCTSDAHTWLYSLLALLALPFVIAGYAVFSAVSGAQAMRDNLTEKRRVEAVKSGAYMWIAIIIAVPMLYASYQLYEVLFPEVEEGRDRLGRICETEGNVTTCRPAPENERDVLDDVNQRMQDDRSTDWG